MKRVIFAALIAVACAACLEPGKPNLTAEDTTAPTLLRSMPARLATTDVVAPRDTLIVVFSEAMDVRSLRPGITVRKDNKDIDIDVFPNGDGGVASNDEDLSGADRPYPVGVKRADNAPWETSGTYTLRLSTLLIDTEGNPLSEGIDIRFRAEGDAGTP